MPTRTGRGLPSEKLSDGLRRWENLPGLGYRDRKTGLELEWVGAPHKRWVLSVDEQRLSRESWVDILKPPFEESQLMSETLLGKFDWPK